MYLKYVEIHGFKSFPDKIKIDFEPGLTAIVGPNGSGKSNISDAIRWVLGEQSSKQLHGSKMQDVIFSGTAKRNPMGFSQVSLCLDNSDRRLPDYEDELIIGRKYFRSGYSEYLINGNTVRLKDVRETFMNTGLSRDGYSIIEQGKIGEIVNAKPEARREIFEEATGIAKFRFKKDTAEKQLSAAEANLERLRDIVDELASRIGPLKRQKETAEKFIVLSEQRKGLEVTLYCDTIDRSMQAVKIQDEKILIANRDYGIAEDKLTDIDRNIEDLFEQTRILETKRSELNESMISAEKEASEAKSAIAITEADIRRDEAELSDLRSRRSDSESESRSLLEHADELDKEAESIDSELASLADAIATAEAMLSSLAEQGEKDDEVRRERQTALNELSSKLAEARATYAAAVSSRSDAEQRKQAASEELPAMEETRDTARANLEELRTRLEETDAEILKDTNQSQGLKRIIEIRRADAEKIRDEYQKLSDEINGETHRLNALEDMEKSQEGFAPSVRNVIDAGRRGRLRGILGTVASLIRIEDGCELAIETALGFAMQNIVVSDERAAKDGIQYLKENRAGRCTFMPLDTMQPSNINIGEARNIYGFVGIASELVKYDKKYSNVVSNLLGRIIIAEDIDSASNIARDIHYRNRVVTLDGQVINAGGSFTGGYAAKSAGVFSRRKEIDKLRESLEEKKARSEKIGAKLDASNQEFEKIRAQITVLDSDMINLNNEKIRIEEEIKRFESESETANAAIDSITQRIAESEKDMKDKENLARDSEKLTGELEKKIADLEKLDSIDQDGDDLQRKRQLLTDELSAKRLERLGRERDQETLKRDAANLRERVISQTDKNAAFDETEQHIIDGIEAKKQQIELQKKLLEETEKKITALKEENSGISRERDEIDRKQTENRREQNELTRQRENLASELSRLEERKATLQKDVESAITKLWEDYELTKAEAETLKVPYTNITTLRQEVATVRGQIRALGTVNVAAIEEYKEVSERYEFLSAQVADVENSKNELMKLISSITGEMREIFEEKFELINKSFQITFTQMFEGGRASLALTDSEDLLESGIEINAQPPGKVIKDLNALSGGEKSLVAIALYFAIFMVNPAPFCILDEIDSALDDINVARFARYLLSRATDNQFIAITHRRGTMEASERLYGVTMQEQGVSKLFKLEKEEAVVIAAK